MNVVRNNTMKRKCEEIVEIGKDISRKEKIAPRYIRGIQGR